MGVDISASIGVGFVIDPDVFAEYRKTVPDEENYADEEILDLLVENRPGIGCGTGGSFYDSGEDNRSWISVKRLTKSYDVMQMPAGVVGLGVTTITLDERMALLDAAKTLGQSEPTIGHFLSVLWH